MSATAKLENIYSFLNELSPFELQEKWDNSGINVGNLKDSFEQVYISIDVDIKTVQKMEENSLLITHHPLIFSKIQTFNFDDHSTKILKLLIKKDIKLICMHTNIDKTHLNKYVATKILGFELEKKEDDFICYSNINTSFEKLKNICKEKLNLEVLKTVKCNDDAKTVAITTGSGMSLLPYIEADCFLTGDIKYHDAMKAKSRNINLIDIGHYESECHFAQMIYSLIEPYLIKNKIKAIIMSSENPFDYK